MLREKLLPTFASVASNAAGGSVSTATCALDLGKKYHQIWLEIGDNAGTTLVSGNLINEIRLVLDGHVQRRMTGKELNALNTLMGADYAVKTSGVPATAAYRTYLPIFLSEPWRKFRKTFDPARPQDQRTECELLGWNLNPADVGSATIEVDIQAGLTSPVLTGWYKWSPLDGRLGAITKWIRQTLTTNGTTNDFNAITRRDIIHSFHLFATSDAKFVNKLQLTANGEIIKDLVNTLENQAGLIAADMNPETTAVPRYDLVLDSDDHLNGALVADGLNEMTLHLEYSASSSGNLVMIMQRTGAPE